MEWVSVPKFYGPDSRIEDHVILAENNYDFNVVFLKDPSEGAVETWISGASLLRYSSLRRAAGWVYPGPWRIGLGDRRRF